MAKKPSKAKAAAGKTKKPAAAKAAAPAPQPSPAPQPAPAPAAAPSEAAANDGPKTSKAEMRRQEIMRKAMATGCCVIEQGDLQLARGLEQKGLVTIAQPSDRHQVYEVRLTTAGRQAARGE